ncbi:hypothetical protein, partial [Vibrio splendidus]|uniref:hypothetical protein n=1 Tax=Vibrio splendidus TaxID=29497 RepID=UPI001A7E15EB
MDNQINIDPFLSISARAKIIAIDPWVISQTYTHVQNCVVKRSDDNLRNQRVSFPQIKNGLKCRP